MGLILGNILRRRFRKLFGSRLDFCLPFGRCRCSGDGAWHSYVLPSHSSFCHLPCCKLLIIKPIHVDHGVYLSSRSARTSSDNSGWRSFRMTCPPTCSAHSTQAV